MPTATYHRLLRSLQGFVALGIVVVGAGCGAGAALPGGSGSDDRAPSNILKALAGTSPTPVPVATGGVSKNGKFGVSLTPTGGLSAAQLRKLYGQTAANAYAVPTGPLIAVVDAFGYKAAATDLAMYRATEGLPYCAPTACISTFSPKAMPGANTKPTAVDTTTWSDETALDLAMVSTGCPTCRILLVETAGEDLDSLANGVAVAATYHPAAISTSWGVVEAGNVAGIDLTAQAAFSQPGIAITAAAGDLGQVQFPASSPFVTSVGGTSLTADTASARGYDETVWQQSATGCSTMFAAPSWMSGMACGAQRGPADVSFLADFSPGIAVYSSVQGGWVVLGGTSAGAPFVAGLYGAANDYGLLTTGAPSIYLKRSLLNVVQGAAGTTLGTPNGLTGF